MTNLEASFIRDVLSDIRAHREGLIDAYMAEGKASQPGQIHDWLVANDRFWLKIALIRDDIDVIEEALDRWEDRR